MFVLMELQALFLHTFSEAQKQVDKLIYIYMQGLFLVPHLIFKNFLHTSRTHASNQMLSFLL